MIRKIFKKNFFKFILKTFFSLFYDKRFLTGRWFDEGIKGYKWCLNGIFYQKILRINCNVPWPVSPFIKISDPDNLIFHPDDLNNFQSFGIYLQNFSAKIFIGRGTYIAPNVGIITSNHDFYNLEEHQESKDVIIGDNSWIGMNSIILPGVILGENTIVGAGSVVTKSFPEGHCIIVGNPAKLLKKL